MARGAHHKRYKLLWLAIAGALLLFASCIEDMPAKLTVWCPEELPDEAAPCEPGLKCTYVAPVGCAGYYRLSCNVDGSWAVTSDCTPIASGGNTGTTSSSSLTSGSGGEAGSGGSPCMCHGQAAACPCINDQTPHGQATACPWHT